MWQIRQAEGVGSGIRVSMGGQTPDGATGDGLLSAGVWGHWAMVFDGSKATNDGRLKVYFDGVDQGPLTFDNGPMPATIPDTGTSVVQIGQHEFFTGAIDEVRIYDGPLTPAEVSALAATAPQACGTVVNSTRDVSDLVPGNGSCDTGALNTQGATECTLRAAMEEANALAGVDTIGFNIPTTELGHSPAPLSYTIQPGSPLPPVTEQVVINGATQPDFPGTPIIVIDGTSAGVGAAGLTVDGVAAGSTIRGLVINNFDYRGIDVYAINNTIVGNWIGLDVDGVTAAGNGATGIFLTAGSNNNTVGGTVAADRNVVSANGLGIWVQGDDNLITGNYIGTDSSGAVGGVGNAASGVRFAAGADGNTLGGTTAAEANIIADNAANGIVGVGTGVANSFLRNSVYANVALGIDLGNDGVTANDAGDPDPGANNRLNWPVITSAFETAGTLDVNFDLDVPAGNYRIEFFTNPSGADPSGNGEGEVYQSNVTIAHGGAGVESFSHSFAGVAGDILTTTATIELAGPTYSATSEFGNAFTAVALSVCPGGVVTNTTDAPTGGSLRACIIWANGNAGADSISFNIPGAGPHTIQPTSALPIITDPVTIDGSTEPDFVTTPVVEIDGTLAGTGIRGLQIGGGGAGSTIRALVINRFDNRGIHIASAGNTIAGNWIGLDIDGLTAAGNTAQGIFLSGAGDNNTIGGSIDADRNVISGNGSRGIQVAGDNNVISHNYIGTDFTGAVTVVGNGSHGVRFNGSANGNMVGGTTAADANIIADNNDGIEHRSTGTANSFLGNSIYGNSNIGIDLAHDGVDPAGANGVTANDALDPDPGSNNLLNFPVITNAAETAGTLNVDFDLDVIPAGNYRIEFFTNPSGADPSGFGQGEIFQSNVTIAHGGAGVESFSHSFAGSAGDIVTVTATLELGGPTYAATSEFGAAFTAVLAAGLEVVKRAFWPDGTAIPSGVDIPSGVEFKYLLYINNTGGVVTDVSVRDVLDPAFAYQTPSIQVDNSVLACALATCDPGEEAAIFTAVDGATVLTDATGDDVVSYGALTVDAGDQNVANLQLDILGNRVWTVMFTVTML